MHTRLLQERCGETYLTIGIAHVTATHYERMRGLIGRQSFDDLMVFGRVRQVHTHFMRFAIDVAWYDPHGVIRDIVTVEPGQRSPRFRSATGIIEAAAGTLTAWGIGEGTQLKWTEPATPSKSDDPKKLVPTTRHR